MNPTIRIEWAEKVYSNFNRSSCIDAEIGLIDTANKNDDKEFGRFLFLNSSRRRLESIGEIPYDEVRGYIELAESLSEKDEYNRYLKGALYGLSHCRSLPEEYWNILNQNGLQLPEKNIADFLQNEQHRLTEGASPDKNVFEKHIFAYSGTSLANNQFKKHSSEKIIEETFGLLLQKVPDCLTARLFRANHARKLAIAGYLSKSRTIELFKECVKCGAEIAGLDYETLIEQPTSKSAFNLFSQVPTRSGLPLALRELALAEKALEGNREAEFALNNLEKNRFDVYV